MRTKGTKFVTATDVTLLGSHIFSGFRSYVGFTMSHWSVFADNYDDTVRSSDAVGVLDADDLVGIARVRSWLPIGGTVNTISNKSDSNAHGRLDESAQ